MFRTLFLFCKGIKLSCDFYRCNDNNVVAFFKDAAFEKKMLFRVHEKYDKKTKEKSKAHTFGPRPTPAAISPIMGEIPNSPEILPESHTTAKKTTTLRYKSKSPPDILSPTF